MDQRGDLPRVTAPTLVVAAAQDPSTPPEHAQEIARHIAGARLEVLNDGAHLVNIERPEQVSALLLDHFSATGGGT
jgi:pimeloyl-ACP methyl ester carboxylesterase